MIAPVLLASAALSAAPASAWSEHALLTRAALSRVAGLDEPVPAETLEQYAAARGEPDGRAGLLKRLALNPQYGYGFRAGESAGRPVPLRAVLETYADEPDQGMDDGPTPGGGALIFSPEQVQSMEKLHAGDLNKAMRHIYWPYGILGSRFRDEFSGTAVEKVLRELYPSLPLDSPFGEAPRRCALMLAESEAAFRAGRPYWGARFLAWSFHYAQDLSQPLHTGALASAHFVCLSRGRVKDCTLRLSSYYHFGLERAALWALKGGLGEGAQAALQSALAADGGAADEPDAEALARRTAERSHGRIAETGRIVWELLPPLKDPLDQDPVAVAQPPGFKDETARAAAAKPKDFAEFTALVTGLFGEAGGVTRALAARARRAAAPPRAVARAPGAARLRERLEEGAAALARQ